MIFATKFWLLAMLMLPVVAWLLRRELLARFKKLEQFIAPSLWGQVIEGWRPGARLRRLTFWIVGVSFLMLTLARPQWGEREEILGNASLDILVALDVSNSMNVEDVAPSRLKKAKHLLRGLAERLGGDRIGLLVFAGGSYLAVPLTNDVDYFLENLEILNSDMVASQGTDIGIALEGAGFALSRGAEEGDSNAERLKESSRAVILLTDGEDHEARGETAAKRLRAGGVKLFVFGIGTEKGGPVPVRNDSGQLKGYKRGQDGQPVISKFMGSSLQKIAEAGSGRYWPVSESEFEIQELLNDLGLLSRSELAERKIKIRIERFQLFLFFAVVFFAIELFVPLRLMSKNRSFLKGAHKAVVMLLLFLGTSSLVACKEGESVSPQTYLKNREGLQALEAGEADEAMKKFNQAQASDPWNPRLNYNQGLARAKKGDLDTAIGNFTDAYNNARDRNDPVAKSSGAFNLGRALQEKGDIGGAVEAYLKAIESAKERKDEKLEAEIRKNIEILFKNAEQQKQQQKKDQEKKDQEKKEQENKEKSQTKSGEEGQENKDGQTKDEPGESKENKELKGVNQGPRKGFKSEKMSKEDAERVLQELGSKEKNLQNKLKKQQKKGVPNGNDW